MRVLLVAVLLFLSRPADACKREYVPLFRIFDDATTVARVRVRAVNSKAVLQVITMLKGQPAKSIALDFKLVGPQTSCAPHLRGVGIIFLTADRNFEAAYDSFPRDKEIVAAITTYAGAKDAAARAQVLVDLIATSKHQRVAMDAAITLADDPEMLVTLTTKDRDRLLLELPNARNEWGLPLVLARLGVDAKLLTGNAADVATNRVFEDITDKDKLADVIAAAKGISPRAAAAFERCERVRGKRLGPIERTIWEGAMGDRLDWKKLADACRN